MNDPEAFVAGLKLLGAGLSMFGAIGAGVGVGLDAAEEYFEKVQKRRHQYRSQRAYDRKQQRPGENIAE